MCLRFHPVNMPWRVQGGPASGRFSESRQRGQRSLYCSARRRQPRITHSTHVESDAGRNPASSSLGRCSGIRSRPHLPLLHPFRFNGQSTSANVVRNVDPLWDIAHAGSRVAPLPPYESGTSGAPSASTACAVGRTHPSADCRFDVRSPRGAGEAFWSMRFKRLQ